MDQMHLAIEVVLGLGTLATAGWTWGLQKEKGAHKAEAEARDKRLENLEHWRAAQDVWIQNKVLAMYQEFATKQEMASMKTDIASRIDDLKKDVIDRLNQLERTLKDR
jgi:hypothetical protein